MVVYAGLCAPFLDVADHTGDRVALILVSALIVVVSFQTDFGLGKISYLMWFDYFNLMQMGVLALALVETLVEHRAAIGVAPPLGCSERACKCIDTSLSRASIIRVATRCPWTGRMLYYRWLA